jgi:hypothetical protein
VSEPVAIAMMADPVVVVLVLLARARPRRGAERRRHFHLSGGCGTAASALK